MLPRAVPRFHRDRRHPSSPGRGRDRSCDDDDKERHPCHDRGTKTCSPGRFREGGREGDRWLVVIVAPALFRVSECGLDDPQEDHPGPRESLQNMDSLLQAGRIPGFRLLSRRRWVWGRLGPLAQQRERHDPGDLAALAIGRGAGGVRRGIVLGAPRRRGAARVPPRTRYLGCGDARARRGRSASAGACRVRSPPGLPTGRARAHHRGHRLAATHRRREVSLECSGALWCECALA